MQNILFPNILTTHWQMLPAERMALTGLLARIRPRYALEIGVYYGGSLSLISQFSRNVFAFDVDPDVPNRFETPSNVDLRIGDPASGLSSLLNEIDERMIPLNFILLDADHSAEAVRRDLNLLLSRPPLEPLFIVMHDTANPDCRQGVLAADWHANPCVNYLEIDFVPGQLVGPEGARELWGGLGLAYLSPVERSGDLLIGSSSLATIVALTEAAYGTSRASE